MEPTLIISQTFSFFHSVVWHTSTLFKSSDSVLITFPFNGSAFTLYCILTKHFVVRDQDCYCHQWLGKLKQRAVSRNLNADQLSSFKKKKLYSTAFQKWSETTLNRINWKINKLDIGKRKWDEEKKGKNTSIRVNREVI